MLIAALLSTAFAPSVNPRAAVATTFSSRGAVVMQARSNWAAMDDGAPLGLLERDADSVFSMLDDNGDGAITRAEMSATLLKSAYSEERIEKVFGKIDINGDDEISLEEWRTAYVKYPTLRTAPGLGGALKDKLIADANAAFVRIDADSDGAVTRTELEDYFGTCGYDGELATSMLKALDFDASGNLDKEEVSARGIRTLALHGWY